MGRGGPDGEVVNNAEWDEFIADMATPRFPDGLAVLNGKGQRRGSDGEIQKESTKVLLILVPNDDEDTVKLIEELSTEYKRRFDQEAVLKNVDHTCVAFQ